MLEKTGPLAPSSLRMRDIPVPGPADDEVLLRVLSCGVCHTDLHTVEGDIVPPSLPVVPGHQVVGRVAELGPGAGLFFVGRPRGPGLLRGGSTRDRAPRHALGQPLALPSPGTVLKRRCWASCPPRRASAGRGPASETRSLPEQAARPCAANGPEATGASLAMQRIGFLVSSLP